MKNKRKIVFFVSVSLSIILALQIIFDITFPNLGFIDGRFTIGSRIIFYITFSLFLISILILFKINKKVVNFIGSILLLFTFINSCAGIHPIDTTTQPVDLFVYQKNVNGTKWVIREYKNVKTYEIIKDTVLVKDNFIFREILDKK